MLALGATLGEMASKPDRRRLVGGMLRTLRTEAGLRQADIAQRLGRPQSYVSKYEAGEQSLDLIEVAEICEALGADLGTFAQEVQRVRYAKN